MSWAITASVGVAAYGAMDSYNQQSASASFNKKQSAYNDKMNAKRAKLAGNRVDTNVVRARTEAADALEGITSASNEAISAARVAQAAAHVGTGSADTIIETFSKKSNKAESNVMQSLVSELVGSRLERLNIAAEATQGMSTSTQSGPSAMGAILGGAVNFFASTKGLSFGSTKTKDTPAPILDAGVTSVNQNIG